MKKRETINMDSYVWKGQKELDESGKFRQNEKKMIDMSEEELRAAYNQCKSMLYNKDPKKTGRYVVLDNIRDQRERCGAELFLRYAERSKGISRVSLISSINEFMLNNKEALANIKPTLDIAFQNLPDEFKDVPLGLVLDGCLDRLGAFSKKHITRTFILKQGVWLTPTEIIDLTEKDREGNIINKLDVIRERLNIKEVEKLSLNSRGLNFTELRAMLILRPNKKYRDLTTVQLETLRNKVLFLLEEDVRKHINFWENKIEQIEEVAKYKNIKL